MARILAQWADSTLFWTAMAHSLSPKGAAQMFGAAGMEAAKAFGQDRAEMRIATPRIRPADGTGAYRSYLRRLASMLEQHDFLLGSQACVADFAACHALWFTRTQTPVMADVLDATPGVIAWLDRMSAIGHGNADPGWTQARRSRSLRGRRRCRWPMRCFRMTMASRWERV